ncbi:MAG: type II toxin-antitoxin system VapC family toxin [Armatimonadetes bacterium]|nr:type II toxin-antitoxin system VapC family toxin [Armatimonadota bacterium]
MEIVIDTAALLAVLLEEPERPALLAATTGAVLLAPASLPWEVGNALVAAVRRRRLTAAEAETAWASYQQIAIRLVEVDIGQAIAVATDRGVYAYDGYMLELARSRGLPLLTLDAKLSAVARLAAIQVVEV